MGQKTKNLISTRTLRNGLQKLHISFNTLVKIVLTWRLSITVPGAKHKFSRHDFLTTFSIKFFNFFRLFNFQLFLQITSKHFIKQMKNFFVQDDKLWKRHASNPWLVILDSNRCKNILQLAHDNLGHRGVYGTAKTISQRFWWPSYYKDVEQYIKTCHECQIRATNKLHIPIMISAPTTLFTKVYLEFCSCPKLKGINTSLQHETTFQEQQKDGNLKEQLHALFSQFIFEELLCRYGAIAEIVTTMDQKLKELPKNSYDIMEFPTSTFRHTILKQRSCWKRTFHDTRRTSQGMWRQY